jgi:hypothetical protein
MPRVLILLLLALPAVALAQSPPPRDPAAAAGCADPRMAFGCANAANLEAMAAPEDLAAGRKLSPARGSQEAAAVARLDADKVKDLKREGTESAGGSPQ